ncbi:MAG: O-antigen ligase family protein [Deltaproteobacteria bacterium]|nr:O-antigen ligase family protein [Deltaproteobacteria bacterium]MCB9788878.1 O-antigen ligase family protein [Deltaproteobacteria bacterium]
MSVGAGPHTRLPNVVEVAAVVSGSLCVAFVAVVAPLMVVPTIALIVVGVLAVRDAFVSLLLFILILLTRPADFIPELARFTPAKVAAFGALSVFLASRLLEGRLSWASVPQNRHILLLAAAAFVSGQLSGDPIGSRIFYLDTFAKILILYFLILNLVDSWRRAILLEYALQIGAVFLSLYALHQRFTGTDLIEGTRAAAIGLLGDPNDLAFMLMMAVPFALLAVRETRGFARWLQAASLLILLAGVAVTQSRGGLLALGAALWFIFRHRVKSRLALVAIMGVGVIGLAIAAGVGSRESYDLSGGDASAVGRLDAWNAGLRMFLAHPVLGVGFDQFVANYFTYVQNPIEWTARTAHNTFVLAIAETGLAGFIPFMLLVWTSVRDAVRLELQPGEAGLGRALRQSQLARLAAILVAAFFLSQTWNWFLYIVLALTAATARIGRIEASRRVASAPATAPSGARR